jgi:hypothetical protein
MSFWAAMVVMTTVSMSAWVIVSIVEAVSKTRSKKHEAQLELERDYLRRMLSEVEDIKAELAKQRERESAMR